MKTILFFHTSLRQAWQKELSGVYRFARTAKWRVQVIEPTHRTPAIRSLLDFWKPAGCLVECSGEHANHFDPEAFGDIPVVFLGRDPRTLPATASFVNPSNIGPGRFAAMELLKSGFSSFAFVASHGNHFWSRDREAEFRRTLRANGYSCEVFGRKSTCMSGNARTKLLRNWLKCLRKPCGIMAENDYCASEVLDVANKLHIRIPQQIAVIGTDNDSSLCENSKPTLSSVFLDFEHAGYRAFEILVAAIEGRSHLPVRETYSALGLIRRGSTPAGIGAPPRISKALDYIRNKVREGISVADVAALMPGSRRLAEMDFRKATGRSIFSEILRVRFECVELLLRDKSQMLGAIATQCGWKTENAMRTAFLKHYGMSMREWRKANVR